VLQQVKAAKAVTSLPATPNTESDKRCRLNRSVPSHFNFPVNLTETKMIPFVPLR